MKEIMIKILLIALALSAIMLLIGSSSGVWGDSETIRDRSHSSVNGNLAPPP
ncbi:hypothetical protein [Paenibacillus marinisediminis]